MFFHLDRWGRLSVPRVPHLLSFDKGLLVFLRPVNSVSFLLVFRLHFDRHVLRNVPVLDQRWSLKLHCLVFHGWLVCLVVAVNFLSNDTDSWRAGIPVFDLHFPHRPWTDDLRWVVRGKVFHVSWLWNACGL